MLGKLRKLKELFHKSSVRHLDTSYSTAYSISLTEWNREGFLQFWLLVVPVLSNDGSKRLELVVSGSVSRHEMCRHPIVRGQSRKKLNQGHFRTLSEYFWSSRST
jgi:hypothetical protein